MADLYSLQSQPSGRPPLVPVNLTKLDVDRLKSDVPKYVKAGILDDSESTWWMETLASLEQTEYDLYPAWPLEYLSTFDSPTTSQRIYDLTLQPTSLDLLSVHPRVQEIHASQSAQTEKVLQ